MLFDLQTTFNQYLTSLRTLQSESQLTPQAEVASETSAEHELIESQLAAELQQLHTEIQDMLKKYETEADQAVAAKQKEVETV